ncbi:alpha/beta fold hydrolase [Rossellomorea vietnamensis]|uniref:Alpha/beta fold hydrolase n=1 Tax=Rossellomorea vietnamensis TaxID=218284 RepID=A0A6I6UV17_9BACI|nr:S9 family peptidase [Rossellomorea vietnamensis]QHE62510.1 alpha/beta fold hydrolase [Rossellomorea vietnamensis]
MNKSDTYLSIEELLSIPAISGLQMSEDGQHVAFVKNTADWEENTYRNSIVIYEKDKGECTTFTEGTSPLWSPDSTRLGYLSAGEGGMKNQIFVESINADGRVRITNEKEGVIQFKWDPSGKGIYYVTPSPESEEIKKRREKYGDFHHVGKDYRNHCLWYVEVKDFTKPDKNVPYQLTDGRDFHIQEFEVSADGEKVVFMATPSPDGEDGQNGEIHLLDRPSEDLRELEGDKVVGGNVCFSPQTTKVCYTASLREKGYYKTHIMDSTLEIYDLTNGERIQPLLDFDHAVVPIRWTAKGILLLWQDKTNYRIGLLSGDGKLDMISGKSDGCILEASITEDGNHLAYRKAAPNETFEVYADSEKITNENGLLRGRLTSNREIISWNSRDGLEIEGVLTTPKDMDWNKKHPLLVFIHGGPDWASFPIHSSCFNEKYPVESFIEKGFIVLEPNYRGSSGYGNDFLKANYRNLGIGDYEDVISGVDALVDRGIADGDRVGVMGWSQGGFISAFCSTYSDRFKAASVGGGISNWVTNYVNTDLPSFIRMHVGDTPWNDPEIYAKASPTTYIQSASTPTLIQHGEKDARVPIPNAYELYKGLKDMGVETELAVFDGMGYSSDKPGIHRAIMEQNLSWFLRWLVD